MLDAPVYVPRRTTFLRIPGLLWNLRDPRSPALAVPAQEAGRVGSQLHVDSGEPAGQGAGPAAPMGGPRAARMRGLSGAGRPA